MGERRGNFMQAGLLDSQLASFEPPIDETDALLIDGTALPDSNVENVVKWLQSGDCQ